jgi:hypothetical protein
MVVRERDRPALASLRRRRPGKPNVWLLCAAAFTVVLAAILIPVSDAPTGKVTVVIPPAPAITFGAATATMPTASPSATAKAKVKAAPTVKAPTQTDYNPPPIAGASYAGSLLLNATGSQLTSWNQTSSFCTQQDWEVPNGTVSTDSSDDAVLTTNGQSGSCVGLISPGAYSSGVVEVYAYFPPLPGSSDIANWTSIWLTDQAAWPTDGELDAVEAEPATGVNAVAWHWGSSGAQQYMSTDGFAADGTLPKDGPNLTPGWHVVDIVYTQGFFAVYYDSKLFTTLSSSVVTGSALNVLITTSVTADNMEVDSEIGNNPQNSDSSPAGMAVKYIKVWSYK